MANMFTKPFIQYSAVYKDLGKFGQRTKYTPDAAVLERRSMHLFLVPDEMMARHRDNARLGYSALRICDAVTQDKFSFWKKNLGKKSMAFPLETEYAFAPKLGIRGELTLVETKQIFKLDEHRENGVQFERRRVKLILPYTQSQLIYLQGSYVWESVPKIDKIINAWMYVGREEYWGDLLDGGFNYSPVDHHTPNNSLLEQYYYFTNREYDETSRNPRPVFRLR